MSNNGLVFNIQRYSVHDGGGIRTIVFLKGCPLKCPWCSNPESRLAVKPIEWLKNGNKEVIGEWHSVQEVVEIVMKDEIFYRTSGGGITLSGGEVLMQTAFSAELLKELHDLGVHTAIETTGCFNLERIQQLTPFLNQVLFDLKIMNQEQSGKVIGANVDLVKANFEYLLAQEQLEVIPRIPLIPGYTDSKENIKSIIDYLLSLKVNEVHLLPFHQYGSNKYVYLDWDYEMQDVATLSGEAVTNIQNQFNSVGIFANIDGLE